MRQRSILLLPLFSLLLPACRPPAEHGVEQRPPPRAETSASPAASGESALAGACKAGEARCASDEVALLCKGGAELEEERCAEGSLCLGEGCLPLRDADGRSIAASALLSAEAEGWLDAWTARGPIAGALPEDDAATSPDAGAIEAPRALCAKDGYVEVHAKADTKKSTFTATYFALSANLVVGRAQRVFLNAGIAGRMRVLVAGRRVIDATRETDPAPFRDEMRVPLDLERGVQRIVVLVEQSNPAPTGFWLRLRSPAGGAPADVLVAPDSQACAPKDLLRADVTKRPEAGGFSLEVKPSFRGLSPRKMSDLSWSAEVKPEKGDPKKIGEGTGSTISTAVSLDKAGTYDVLLKFGGDLGDVKIPLVYRGKLHERVVELGKKRESIISSAVSTGDKDSLMYHLENLEQNLADGDPDISWIKRQATEAEELIAALEKGGSPYANRRGVVRRAYRSPLDGRLQPYVLFVPGAYKPGGKALPLVVAAHGLGNRPEIALRVVVGEAPEGGFNGLLEARHLPGLPDLGAFIVAPWQFGNSGQRHLGEDDALRVIQEVRAAYPIDERRISVTGYSLGGTVAFFLPLHYPDIFSSSAPLCGYPNLLGWDSIRKPPHTPWEDVIIQKRYIANWAENGQHVPLFMVHGGLDDPTRSELMANRYRSLGYFYKLDVQEDLDHNVWDYAYEDGDMIGWLNGHKRPKTPERVRFVSWEWRYEKSYWVRLVAPEKDSVAAEIDARSSKSENTVTVKTKNVASFGLDLKELPLREGARLVVDEKTIEGAGKPDMVWLDKQNGAFALVAEKPPRAGLKRAGVSGPLDDIDRHEKLIVYGTQDPAQIEANRLAAEHFATFDTFAARFPWKPDVEVTDDEIAKKSLILIGNTRSNRVTAMLEASLPVRFEPAALTFRGARYEGEDVGVSFIYPNPKNSEEYVVLHAGVTAAGTLASRHLPRFSPDFLVYDNRITVERGGHLLDKREVLAGGFFDTSWK